MNKFDDRDLRVRLKGNICFLSSIFTIFVTFFFEGGVNSIDPIESLNTIVFVLFFLLNWSMSHYHTVPAWKMSSPWTSFPSLWLCQRLTWTGPGSKIWHHYNQRKSCSCRWHGTHLTRWLIRADTRSNRPLPKCRGMRRERQGDPLCPAVENDIQCRASSQTWTFCLRLNWPTGRYRVPGWKM